MNVRIEGQEVGKVEEIPTWWNQVVNVHDQAGNKVRNISHCNISCIRTKGVTCCNLMLLFRF